MPHTSARSRRAPAAVTARPAHEFVGAALLKAQFERSAYGCKLYCCWCAQDIEANRFWESMGFIPLAFRAGSAQKGRVHIFWQRRIRAGDETTSYWFPTQTNSGSIREDRLVLPIPPGKHWSDEMPRILPSEGSTKLEAPKSKQIRNPKCKIQNKAPAMQKPVTTLGRLQFTPPVAPKAAKVKPATRQRVPRPKVKNDSKLVAAARELRDRWLEHANAHPQILLSRGKYDLSRELPDATQTIAIENQRSLPAIRSVSTGAPRAIAA